MTHPLNVTQEASHRIFVGLGWDPNDNPGLLGTIGSLISKRQNHHDLDLSCYYFDADKQYLGVVTALPDMHADPSVAIYHSGDNEEGIGEGDDEQISVELKNIPDTVHHLIFKAAIKSGHHFDDINGASIRLCDGYTDRCFLEAPLEGRDAAKNNSYMFVKISRIESGWHYSHINEYADDKGTMPWGNHLHNYL